MKFKRTGRRAATCRPYRETSWSCVGAASCRPFRFPPHRDVFRQRIGWGEWSESQRDVVGGIFHVGVRKLTPTYINRVICVHPDQEILMPPIKSASSFRAPILRDRSAIRTGLISIFGSDSGSGSGSHSGVDAGSGILGAGAA